MREENDNAKTMQIRSDVETDKDFDLLLKLKLSGCKTKGELMKKLLQLGFMEQIKERKLQEIDIESEDIAGTSILKLQHFLDGIAKAYVDLYEVSIENLFNLQEKKQEEIATRRKENDVLSRRVQEMEKELETAKGKVLSLEDAAKTNAEVLTSYENYKKLTQPKVEEIERKLEDFEVGKKEELVLLQQTIHRLQEELRLEKDKNSDYDHANKQLIIEYETKLLEERGRSSEAQDKIRKDMQVQLDLLREQMWKMRTEKSPGPGRPPKQRKESDDEQA
ncbi:hypothetical protein MHB77_08805 [Paenibacillus sp. FSL K6-3166]|uniref:hypothetical protein n=1 Tax=unclassified Paenibacillus TaxID=185978 RepID=UPI000BA15018|nr:hypothetical protein [Paenibacillus sp. VTT E-133291]MBY3618621.1 hypothetical protein [Acinetobacter sp. CUI P1]OZQ97257.1 hypothetical protein CA598_06790 [Paenibacillus sp. VTT E-133291]